MKSIASSASRAIRSQTLRARRDLATAAAAATHAEVHQQSTPIASTSTSTPAAAKPLPPAIEPSRAPHIVIPAPGLKPIRGTNRLRIDVAGGVSSSAHTLAIVQALEERVGRIVHIQQTKVSLGSGLSSISFRSNQSPFSQQNEPPVLKSRIYVTLLHPVTLKDTLRLEVPSPKLHPDFRTAGPSLAEIEDALLPPSDTDLIVNRKDLMIVTVNEAPKFDNALGSRLGAGSARSWRNRRQVSEEAQERQKEVDDEIFQTLGRWDGFYGGFQGLRKQYEPYSQEAEKTQAQKRIEAEQKQKAEEQQREELHQAAIKAFRAKALEATKPKQKAESSARSAETSAQDLLQALSGNAESAASLSTGSKGERTDKLAERVRQQARRERLLASRAGGSAAASSASSFRRQSNQSDASAASAGFKVSKSTEPRPRRSADEKDQPKEGGNPLSVVKHWFIGSNKTP